MRSKAARGVSHVRDVASLGQRPGLWGPRPHAQERLRHILRVVQLGVCNASGRQLMPQLLLGPHKLAAVETHIHIHGMQSARAHTHTHQHRTHEGRTCIFGRGGCFRAGGGESSLQYAANTSTIARYIKMRVRRGRSPPPSPTTFRLSLPAPACSMLPCKRAPSSGGNDSDQGTTAPTRWFDGL